MGLRHAVITSVDRDDLPDYGASAFVGVIRQIRRQAPRCKVEVLTPDFRGPGDAAGEGDRRAARRVQPQRRGRARASIRSPAAARVPGSARCRVLRNAKEMGGDEVTTKSGLMVGLGETLEEMVETLRAAARARRPGADGRPVPAPDRAPPADRPLLAPRRVHGAGGRRVRARLRPRRRRPARAQLLPRRPAHRPGRAGRRPARRRARPECSRSRTTSRPSGRRSSRSSSSRST